MEVRRIRRQALLCGGVLLAAAFTGGACGGDDDDTAARTVSAANEAPDVFVKRMAKLLATTGSAKDCTDVQQANGRSLVRFDCPASKKLRSSMGRFKIVGAKEYGTGAVVDYRSGKARKGAAIVLYVSPDRNWGISRFGLLTEPSTDTTDEDSRDDFDKTVNVYLDAVRKRNCADFAAVSLTNGANRRTICRTTFAGTKQLAERLKKNPSAKPVYQGGNDVYGFYTLETKKPRPENSTISLAKGEEDGKPAYLVLDVAVSPTAADQRRFQREFEKQMERQKTETAPQPSKSPSSKASS